MDPNVVGVLGMAAFVVILMLKVPCGYAMALVGFLGMLILRGSAAWMTMATIPYSSMASWSLSVLPMFILMGYTASNLGFTRDAYMVAQKWMGRVPGGLAIATLTGAAAFGAVCGSSGAATAALGKICLPEMERYKYNIRLAIGSISVAGTLAALIPPSILAVMYAVVTEQSAGRQLIAGLLPGVLSMFLYQSYVTFVAVRHPDYAPKPAPFGWGERIKVLPHALPLLVIFLVVIGGLFTGILSPTQTGAVGAFSCIVVGFAMRRLNFNVLKTSLAEGLRSCASILAIILGAYIFIQFLAVSRVTVLFTEFMAGLPLPPVGVFAMIVVAYLILGCFLDAFGLLLLTVPFVYPVMIALGFDGIWFGVIVVKLIEVGLLTPPVGLQGYVLKGVAPHVALTDIWMGMLPLVVVDVLIWIPIMVLFPGLATWLPSMMVG